MDRDMDSEENMEVDWSPEDMLEIELPDDDAFHKIKETLTRIGFSSVKNQAIYQSCHILHKKGHYYIVHFKEMFALDGKPATLTENDIMRRNRIAHLLEEWGLCTIVNPDDYQEQEDLSHIKIIRHSEKDDWNLIAKYKIGSKG